MADCHLMISMGWRVYRRRTVDLHSCSLGSYTCRAEGNGIEIRDQPGTVFVWCIPGHTLETFLVFTILNFIVFHNKTKMLIQWTINIADHSRKGVKSAGKDLQAQI